MRVEALYYANQKKTILSHTNNIRNRMSKAEGDSLYSFQTMCECANELPIYIIYKYFDLIVKNA